MLKLFFHLFGKITWRVNSLYHPVSLSWAWYRFSTYPSVPDLILPAKKVKIYRKKPACRHFTLTRRGEQLWIDNDTGKYINLCARRLKKVYGEIPNEIYYKLIY